MAKDEETGIDAVANDGDVDDVTAARRKREAQEKRTGTKGSIAERAENGQLEDPGEAPDEEDDGQGMFVWEQGRKVTLANIIARGTRTEHAFVFGGKRTRGTGGLMGFDAKPLQIVSSRPGPVKLVPTYDDDEKVIKVTIEQHVDARVVANADSEEGLMMIAHLLEAHGYTKVPAAS